jgi:hypothetical protein
MLDIIGWALVYTMAIFGLTTIPLAMFLLLRMLIEEIRGKRF